MENASKALLIAASVLIVILLIGVGMLIFNSIGSTTDQVGSTADTMAIQAFNGKFEKYEGTSVSASNVRALIREVNASNINSSNKVQIGEDFGSDVREMSDIVNSHRYTVILNVHERRCPCSGENTSNGYICGIEIWDNNV